MTLEQFVFSDSQQVYLVGTSRPWTAFCGCLINLGKQKSRQEVAVVIIEQCARMFSEINFLESVCAQLSALFMTKGNSQMGLCCFFPSYSNLVVYFTFYTCDWTVSSSQGYNENFKGVVFKLSILGQMRGYGQN